MAEKKLRVTQVKSQMGLGRIGKSKELTDNESVRGMIFKVKHLIEVEEI